MTSWAFYLYLSTCVCRTVSNEHCILQGTCEFKNNKGRNALVNVSVKPLHIPVDKIILPDNECVKDQSLKTYVNTISKIDLNITSKPDQTKSPITMDMFNVGSKVSEEQREKLLALLNRYRNCFAFKIQELGTTQIVHNRNVYPLT